MADYVSDTPISQPLHIATVDPDVNLNGMMFSYIIGLMYVPNAVVQPIKLPPPFQGSW